MNALNEILKNDNVDICAIDPHDQNKHHKLDKAQFSKKMELTEHMGEIGTILNVFIYNE